MNIQEIFKDSKQPNMVPFVSNIFANTKEIPSQQLQNDFYTIDLSKIINLLNQTPQTHFLNNLIKNYQNQLLLIGTPKKLKNCIFQTQEGLKGILVSTHTNIFKTFSQNNPINDFIKSLSLGVITHITQDFPPQKLYQLIETLLHNNATFFSQNSSLSPTKEEIANQLLLYYYHKPENLKEYLDDCFSTKKYYPTTEEVDKNTTLKGWWRDFKDSLFGRSFDKKIKNQIFQEIEDYTKRISHYYEYQSELSSFFTPKQTFQQKEISFETCMYMLKDLHPNFKDLSLKEFIKGIKELAEKDQEQLHTLIQTIIMECFSFENPTILAESLVNQTCQMIKNYYNQQSNEKDLEVIIDILKDKNQNIGNIDTKIIKADFKKDYQEDTTQDKQNFKKKIQNIFQYDLNDDEERKEAVNIIFEATQKTIEPQYQQAA